MKIKKVDSLYSQDQLAQYLKRIKWSKPSPPTPCFEDLKELMRRHLCSVPFSNAFLVFEQEPPALDTGDLFDRIVRKPGGFFCFGQNLLFREMLRAIGFRCYSGCARVNANHAHDKPTKLTCPTHMIIFVALNDDVNESDENHLYLADVGFGGTGIVEPIHLQVGSSVKSATDQYHRIYARQSPESSLEKLDIPPESMKATYAPAGMDFTLEMQARDKHGTNLHDWRVIYAFGMQESFIDDYVHLHYAVCRLHPLFTQHLVLCVYVEQEGTDVLARKTLYDSTIKLVATNKESETRTLQSEKERMEVLESEFGQGGLPSNAEEIVRSKGLALA